MKSPYHAIIVLALMYFCFVGCACCYNFADVAVLHGTAWFHFRWLVPTNFNSNMINHLLRRRKQCNNNNNRKQCNNYPTNPPSHAHTHFMAPNAKRNHSYACAHSSSLSEWDISEDEWERWVRNQWEMGHISGDEWEINHWQSEQLMIISGGILYTIL